MKLIVFFFFVIYSSANDFLCEKCRETRDYLVDLSLRYKNQSLNDIESICGFFLDLKICRYYVMMIGDPAFNNSLEYLKISDALCRENFCFDGKTIQVKVSDFENYLNAKFPKIASNPTASDEQPFKVLVLNDLHLQKNYKEGTLVECGLPAGCCQSKWGKPSKGTGAGYWGTRQSNCDIPERTFLSTLEHIKSKTAA